MLSEQCKNAEFQILISCFNGLDEDKKKKYRNELIDFTLLRSPLHCKYRLDKLAKVINTGNTLQSWAADAVGATGSIATDAITSRIASGVGVGLSSLWRNAKSNYLSGGNYATLSNLIANGYKLQQKELEEFRGKEYSEANLLQTLIEIEKYDQVCDIFQ